MNISAVSYLNTKPFLYGLEHFSKTLQLDIQLDTPAQCAQKLLQKEVSIGLVPVAILPELPNAQIISNYCIGAEQAVQTVCLFSHSPIEELEEVFLDYQSRTSVLLVQYLCQYFWKKKVVFRPTQKGFETQQLSASQGNVVIGDRAIHLDKQFPYCYDLAACWIQHTGLPFVFAAWVSVQPLATDFVEQFDRALAWGLTHRQEVAALQQKNYTNFDVLYYYNQAISYELTHAKRQGLELFLNYLKQKNLSS